MNILNLYYLARKQVEKLFLVAIDSKETFAVAQLLCGIVQIRHLPSLAVISLMNRRDRHPTQGQHPWHSPVARPQYNGANTILKYLSKVRDVFGSSI